MDNTKLPRAIVDKWLSVLTKEKICFRVGCGKYFKNKINDYEIERGKHNKLKKQFPLLYWVYLNARNRCNKSKNKDFSRYGGRGIKFLITLSEIVDVWVRDKGWLLKTPSIDRIDNNGHYEITNIRFIEQSENTRRQRKNKKPVLLLTYKGEIKNDLSYL
jgi:hypothetical protein